MTRGPQEDCQHQLHLFHFHGQVKSVLINEPHLCQELSHCYILTINCLVSRGTEGLNLHKQIKSACMQ